MFRWRWTSRNSSVGAIGKGRSGEEGYAACVVDSAWGCYALSRVLIPARRPLREWVTAVSHRIAEFSDSPLSLTSSRPSSPRDLRLPSDLGSPREPLCTSPPRRVRGCHRYQHASRIVLLSRIIWDVECAACKGEKERTDCLSYRRRIKGFFFLTLPLFYCKKKSIF